MLKKCNKYRIDRMKMHIFLQRAAGGKKAPAPSVVWLFPDDPGVTIRRAYDIMK